MPYIARVKLQATRATNPVVRSREQTPKPIYVVAKNELISPGAGNPAPAGD